MKAFLIFLGLAVACGAECEQDLVLKFGMPAVWPWLGKDNFIRYPKTKAEAIAKGYEITPGPKIEMTKLKLYCLPEKDGKIDRTICLYIDDETGHVVGLIIAIRKDEVSHAQFDMRVQGWKDWKVKTKYGYILSYIYKLLLFVSREYLEKSEEERIACRKENKLFPQNAIWLSGFNNNLDRIPTLEADLESYKFTKQNFFPMMGTHYYLNMKPTLQCTADNMYPWFILTDKVKNVIGVGLMLYGKLIEKSSPDTMFENPGGAAVKAIVRDGSPGLYKMAEDGFIRTLHIYFCKNPNTNLLP